LQQRKPAQPKTRFFVAPFAKLPRVDYLFRLPPHCGHYTHGVFNANARGFAVGKHHKKVNRGLLPSIRALGFEVSRARCGKVSARRECNHNIPFPQLQRNRRV
jgi:hypothetical protein